MTAQDEIVGVAELIAPIVEAGEAAFDNSDAAYVLASAGLLISHLEDLPCGAF
jgi:hypothetical protein